MLSITGGVVGIALAFALSGHSRTLLSQFMPTLFGADRALSFSTALDLRVLAFAVAVSIASGLLFGLSPALGATRLDLMRVIREGTTTGGTTRSRWSTTHLLVSGQTALAVMLLVAAFDETVRIRNSNKTV